MVGEESAHRVGFKREEVVHRSSRPMVPAYMENPYPQRPVLRRGEATTTSPVSTPLDAYVVAAARSIGDLVRR